MKVFTVLPRPILLLAAVSCAIGHGLIQDPPSRNWFCGAITKPDHVLNGVAQYPACGGAFANDFSGGYSFMSVLTHAEGRAVVRPLPQNVCGFNSETWQGKSTPWDQPIDWPTNNISPGPRTFSWNISWGSHFSDTKEFRYWITKPDFQFQVGRPLAWTDFEEAPFCSLQYDDSKPTANPDVVADKARTLFHTRCTVPPRQGRHVIYAEWGRNHFTFERFHGCVDVVFGATSGFSLSTPVSNLRLSSGETAAITVAIQRNAGFTAPVAFGVTGLPQGLSATFAPSSASGATTTLTFSADTSVAAGRATAMVTGTSGVLTHTIPIVIDIEAQPGFSLSTTSSVLSLQRGSSAIKSIDILRTGGFSSGIALEATGLPAGVSASFNPATAAASSVLILTASTTAVTGPATITVTGTSGSLRSSVPIPISISSKDDASFSLLFSPPVATLAQGNTVNVGVTITRTGGLTSPIVFAASELPVGVTATFSPVSVAGTSTTLTLAASKASVTGAATALISATGGGVTKNLVIPVMINAAPDVAAVSVSPQVNVHQPWYNELAVRLNNTAPITALSVTITIQKAPGVAYAGQYNTIGGHIQQSTTSTADAEIYKYTLAPGQTLGVGSHWLFAAQASGNGALHPIGGDTYELSYTIGGVTFTQSGRF